MGLLSLRHCILAGSGAHSGSYPMGTAAFSPVAKRPKRESDHLPPSSVEVKNAWHYTSIRPISLHVALLG
jgi:hypothetical protein